MITGKSVKFDDMMKALKREIRKDQNKWKACAETRFMTLAGDDDFSKLQAILDPGSTFKNTDKETRSFLLAQVIKHLDPQIWEKVDKSTFKRKFADYDASKSFTDLRDDFLPQTLAQQIEQKFGEEESFMIQIGMSETLEKIRQGQTVDVEEEKKAEEEKKEEVEELNSSRFMQEFENSQQIAIPDYHTLLTDTYALRNEVSESFYN